MTPDPLDDAILAARDGDEAAFAWLWRDLNPRLVRYLSTLAPAGSASDIASETWLQVVRHLGTFDGDGRAFRGWLFTIARSKVVDAARRDRRRPATHADDDALAATPAADDTEAAVFERIGTDRALALIATLPPDQAEVIMLRVVADLDTLEVARIVRKSPGAVRVLAHRGLRRLQELVGRPAVEIGKGV
jgi:RNA polymerase sigma-70 factor (ECF subfamily)